MLILLLFGKYGMGRATSKSRKVPLTKSSKSPFTKGDFKFPPLEKGGEGGFLDCGYIRNEFEKISQTMTLPSRYEMVDFPVSI